MVFECVSSICFHVLGCFGILRHQEKTIMTVFFDDSVPLPPLLLLNVLVSAFRSLCLPGERSTKKVTTLSLFARFNSLEEFHR